MGLLLQKSTWCWRTGEGLWGCLAPHAGVTQDFVARPWYRYETMDKLHLQTLKENHDQQERRKKVRKWGWWTRWNKGIKWDLHLSPLFKRITDNSIYCRILQPPWRVHLSFFRFCQGVVYQQRCLWFAHPATWKQNLLIKQTSFLDLQVRGEMTLNPGKVTDYNKNTEPQMYLDILAH